MDWCHFGAFGASIGLLLLWTRRVVKKVDGAVGKYHFKCFVVVIIIIILLYILVFSKWLERMKIERKA